MKRFAAPEAVSAGLYFYFSCWDEAHSTADAVENPDGYFWHAIVHRQEPDPGNSAYWFRKTGAHPIFPELGRSGRPRISHGPALGPVCFIQFCETAGKRPGSKEERLARQVQLVEWQLLFDHCARGPAC